MISPSARWPAAPTATPASLASREILFVIGIDEYLPPDIRGLMLIGLLAALASTLDTHLNWGASYWSTDGYDRLWDVGGQLQVEPDRRHARRIVLATSIELAQAAE